MLTRRWIRIVLAATAFCLVAIQLVPVNRDNPPEEQPIAAPPEVLAVLERSCFDCHSRRTEWPWYSYVAPVSWLVARDVHEAREELDLSTWNRLDEDDRRDAVEEIWEEVADGEMPLPIYLTMHPRARLSEADRAVLRRWAALEGD